MLTEAIQLIEKQENQKARKLLFDLLDKQPGNAEVNYYIASAYDAEGSEREAIPYYEKALSNKMAGKLRQEAFIQLGSSYRCIGEYEKAKEILLKGLEEFPNNMAMNTFLAMTMYNLKENNIAVAMLLDTLTASSDDLWVKKYQRAIKFYANNLDKIWQES